MQKQEPYILWLPSWYPNEVDPFDGDFIQRHAQAAATQNTIHVLFVKPIQQKEKKRQLISTTDQLTEQIIYIKKEHGYLKKLMRQTIWFQTYMMAINELVKSKGQPLMVHVHVPWRAGMIALWLKRKFGFRFIVSEHYGIYNEVVADRFSRRSLAMQFFVKYIFKQAEASVAVSQALARDIQQHGVLKNFVIIPNVVDANLFYYSEKQNNRFTFLHVSNMVPLKNVAGILDAFQMLQQTSIEAQLVLIGNLDDTYVKYADRLNLKNDSVFFRGELPHTEVAREMRSAHCLVLNSTMESASCVVAEALCCGIPVVATAVGGVPELTCESNSILIPPNDTTALCAAMKQVYENFATFDRIEIATTAANRFNVRATAQRFAALYNSIQTTKLV